MRTLPKTRTWIVLILTLGFLGLLVTEVARENPVDGHRRTDPIRQNLSRLRGVLMTVERHLDSVHEVNESEQLVLMQSAVELFREYLLPHLAAEEAVLHPAVDRQLPRSSASVTEAMRQEHDILRRWVRELEGLAYGSMPDHDAFVRRGERLLGLIEAHFEVDEEVLYPVLDRALPLGKTVAGAGP